jgi:hypothetical protein
VKVQLHETSTVIPDMKKVKRVNRADTEETGFKQLVSCNVKVQLHKTSTVIPDVKKVKRVHRADTEETGFKQLVSCNVKVHLHETSTVIPDMKKGKTRTQSFKRRRRKVKFIPKYSFSLDTAMLTHKQRLKFLMRYKTKKNSKGLYCLHYQTLQKPLAFDLSPSYTKLKTFSLLNVKSINILFCLIRQYTV